MPDSNVLNDPLGRDMIVQALLYASGELEGSEALSFERRLSEDQTARDALCQAVHLSEPLRGPLALRPDPVYREHVRQRLRSVQMSREILRKPRGNTGHPILWGVLGAAAAALLTLALQKACFTQRGDSDPGQSTVDKGGNGTVTKGVGKAGPISTNELPSIRTDLPNREPLQSLSQEELQRRSRTEESRRPAPPPGQRPRTPVRRTVTQ